MSRAAAILLLPLVCMLASPLTAQERVVRAHLEADLVAAEQGRNTTVTSQLPPGSEAPHVRQLQEAFDVLLHHRAATDAGQLSAAMTQLYELTVRHPDWPYAWLGLGLVKFRLDELGIREIRSAHQAAGSGWLVGALAAFERALQVEPDLGRAAMGVGDVMLRSQSEEIRRRGFIALRAFAARNVIDAPAGLALARVAVSVGEMKEADEYLRRYFAAGGDPAVGAWELAIIRFAEGRAEEGAQSYFEAAGGQGETVAALLRADVALVADSVELADFDRIKAEGRVSWLRDFWTRREAADGRPAGSRLQEHFRRVRYAFTNFAYLGSTPQYDFEQVYRMAPHGLDDRGVIYIRHGEPDERANYQGEMQTYPNESWLYFRPSGNLVFHFAALRTAGYRLLESLEPIIRYGGTHADLYTSRGGFDPSYLSLAGQYEIIEGRRRAGVQEPLGISPIILERERLRNREFIRRGTTTDSDPLDLDRSWSPITQVFGLPSTTLGQAGLLVVIALPAPADLTPLLLPGGGAGYVVRLRTTAADDSGRTTLDADSIVRLRTPRPLVKGQFLTIVRSYTLPAGTQRVRVIIADSAGEHGAVRVLSGVPAVDLSTPNLVMSDLVVGREESGVTWTAPNGTTIPLQPLNAWRTSDAMAINFEVSGLAAGQSYKVRIGLGDLGADSTTPPKASVEFENQASGARELVSQSLSLRGVRPGKYLLTATITSGDKVIRRERRITVAGAR